MKNIYVDEIFTQHSLLDPKEFKVRTYDGWNTVNADVDPLNDYFMFYNVLLGGGLDLVHTSLPNYIDCNRVNDLTFGKICKTYGIKIPNLFYSHDIRNCLTYLEDDKEYILRYFGHARSLGQLVFKKEDLFQIYEDVGVLDCDAFNIKWKVSLGQLNTENEKRELYGKILRGQVFISEKINFSTEYRLLLFRSKKNDRFLIEAREGYGPNSNVDRKHWVIDLVGFKNLVGSKKSKEILDACYKVLNGTTAPAMSFDLYVTEDKDWGLFEFSTQFGVLYTGYYKYLVPWYTEAMKMSCELVNQMQ